MRNDHPRLFTADLFPKEKESKRKVYRDKRGFLFFSNFSWEGHMVKELVHGREAGWVGSGGIFRCVYEITMCESLLLLRAMLRVTFLSTV